MLAATHIKKKKIFTIQYSLSPFKDLFIVLKGQRAFEGGVLVASHFIPEF